MGRSIRSGLEYTSLQVGLSRYPTVLDKLMDMAVSRQILLNNLQKTKVANMVFAMQSRSSQILVSAFLLLHY